MSKRVQQTSVKMSWFQATKHFFGNKAESGMFAKIMAFLGFTSVNVMVFDDLLDFIPGLNILTVGDNLVVYPFLAFAVIRITMIRHKANKYTRPYPA